MITPEQIADEERRAQLWQDQAARRVQFQTSLWFGQMAGDPSAAARVRASYQALLDAELEARMPDYDPEDDPGFDPLGISDSVNVGT